LSTSFSISKWNQKILILLFILNQCL